MEPRPEFDFEKYNIGNGINMEDLQNEARQQYSRATEQTVKQNNPFPVEVFPQAVQQIIKATKESLNFPVDFTGCSMLYAVSVATGNTYKLQVKNGWNESTVLYLAIVGPAGTIKSHPLTFSIKPIVERDKQTFREYQKLKTEFDKACKLSKKERTQQVIDEPVKPAWQKFIVSDFTPEALAEVHRFNMRGLGVYADELAGWFKNFNRYHKGAEQEFWLSCWSGKPITIDRKTSEPVFIPLPFISVCGTIQNGILDTMAKDNRSQNGFIDRILFSFPDNLQKEYWSDKELSTQVFDNWHTILNNVLELPLLIDENYTPNPGILSLTTEAKQALAAWERSNTNLIRNAQNDHTASIYSKLEMYVLRLALILELLYYACGESKLENVGIKAATGAMQLIEYFRNTATKVHTIISGSSPVDKLSTDKRNLYELLPDNFTTSTGLEIAHYLGIPERTFKYFLNDKDLFIRIKTGEYEKKY
ncbi:DUF3987 domain-containing protein [Rhodocytophaga rosea]|uniref:DUF3987 domain-containing protein n=1 Tax=Rhodocytophaga rosea TaxID=2704465 RepID=A0A6C0GUF3_9BACT|nr:DUF3987 domain-containing protein [Rhodocytophaga rosea]QHT71183.1 DUF3987 domain-containing protein [Rhodocytophaga rosea]